MAESLELTPSDELTGLPLPILAKSADYYFRRADYHHHFHPKVSPDLGYDESGKKLPMGTSGRLEGIAVRQSRGQHVPIWLHDRYHKIFYGPDLPQEPTEKFTAVILACAGVVPRQAIDLYNPGESRIVNLGRRRHNFIRQMTFSEGAHSTKKEQKRDNIGRFIADYAINNSLEDAMNESNVSQIVDQFLEESDPDKKLQQGKYILEQAVGASVSDVIDIYRETKSEGMVYSTGRRLGEVALDYFPEARFRDYVGPLELRLQSLLAS